MITYRNYIPVAYPDEKLVPVPGWGMRKFLAGSPVIAIDEPINPATLVLPPPFSGLGNDVHARRHAFAQFRPHRPTPVYTRQIVNAPSYIVGRRGLYSGLGTDITIGTPVGNQTISVPMDVLAQAAVTAAWPAIQQNLEAEFPKLLDQAQPMVQDAVQTAVTNAKKSEYYIGAAIVLSVFAAAWWVKKGK
jgi:hypothetical protein